MPVSWHFVVNAGILKLVLTKKQNRYHEDPFNEYEYYSYAGFL